MPASPRVAAIGLGTATVIALGIPLVAGFIATGAMHIRNQRTQLRQELSAIYDQFRAFGEQIDSLPKPSTHADLFDGFPLPIVGVTGKYAVFEDDFPIHRLPKNVIAFLNGNRQQGEQVRTIDATAFDAPETTLADVLGDSHGIGIGVVFADGLVLTVRDDMRARVLRPFLTRNTAVRHDRDRELVTYLLK